MKSFSPLLLYYLIRQPLVYFFSSYSPESIKFDEDETKTDLLITSKDNYYEIKEQIKPRILIDRGSYLIESMGLDNSLYQKGGPFSAPGANKTTHIQQISGTSSILIESRNSGTCELLTDIVTHFLTWSGPLLCVSQGFKKFGTPLQVSSCSPVKEDIGLFQVTISIPWITEELWVYSEAGVKLKAFFATLQTGDTTVSLPL
jgi:hypothetical protein